LEFKVKTMKRINLYHIISFVIGLIFLISPCSAWSNKPIGDSTAVPELSSPATNTEARGENDSLKLNFETVIKEIFDKKKEEFKQTVFNNERLRLSGSSTSGDYIFDFNFDEEVKKYILFYKKKPNIIPEVTNEFDSIQAFKLLNLEINNWSKQSHNPDIYCVYIKVDEKMLWTSSLDAYNLGNKNESAVVKYLKENLETDSNKEVLTTFYEHMIDYKTFAKEFLNSRSTSAKGIFLNTYFCYDRLYKDSENKSDKILQQGYYNLFANEIIDTTKSKCVSILAASMRNDFEGIPEFKCFSAFVNAIMIVFDDKNNYKCDQPIDSSGGNLNSSIIVHNFTSESIDSLLSNLFEGREKKEYDDVGYRRDIKAVLILTDHEDDFAAADSVLIPNGYRKIWIHKENGVYSIKSLDTDNYPGFEPLLGYLGASEALIVSNFIMEANYATINEVTTQTYLFLDMLAKGIRGLKIPEEYWNCDKPEIYNVYYQDIASYLMKPYVLPRQYLFNKLDLISPKFKTLVDLQTDEAQFAFMCGMWGGLLEIVAAIPDVLKIVPAILSEQGRDEMAKVWNALTNYSKVDSVTMEKIHEGFGWAIVDGLSDQFDPTKPCKFSYNVAELAVPIVIALIPGGQGAGVSVAGKILNTFKSIMTFEDKINCISLVLNKTGSVAVRLVSRTTRHIAEVMPSNWFKNIRKKVNGKLEEEIIDNDVFRAEYDEPSNTINGEELMDLNNPIVRNFSISNELIDLIKSNSKKFFSPDVLRQYNELITAIKGAKSIANFDDFLNQLQGTYPQLRQMMEEGRPFTERYFKYKYLDQLEELGISQSQLTNLTNKFPNKNFEIEILLCNIDPTYATALVDDLMTASVSFTNKLMGDGKLVRTWEKMIKHLDLRKNADFFDNIKDFSDDILAQLDADILNTKYNLKDLFTESPVDVKNIWKELKDNPFLASDFAKETTDSRWLKWKDREFFKIVTKAGKDFEEYVISNVNILKTKILAKYPNINLSDYEIFTQVQMKTGLGDEFFVADIVIVKRKTITVQGIEVDVLDYDNAISIETKLSQNTNLTTPQNHALTKVKSTENTFDIRSISKQSESGNYSLGNSDNLKVNNFLKVWSNGQGGIINDLIIL